MGSPPVLFVWRLVTFLGATMLLALFARDASAQTLDQVRRDVRTPRESSDDDHDDEHRECEDDDGGLGKLLFDLTFGTLLEGLSGGSEWRLGTDPYGRMRYERWYPLRYQDTPFTPYPYMGGAAGIDAGSWGMPGAMPFSARVAAEYGTNFDGLSRWGGSGLIEWSSGLGFDASGYEYQEDVPTGVDRLAIGDANVFWRFLETERSLWRLGVGGNWIDDDVLDDLGLNFTVRGDWFPCAPLIVSGEVDWGTVGFAHQFHGRVTAGLNFHQCEAFIGYDYRSIGQAELQGPLAGMQFWW
jgi:hypothetical protein